ncbi:hypothetical protein HPB52_000259 [Rhipicephalus sanguineus]|uniref:Uncharacterized protein n=1 Tax=Rhipicephalus sanguineus TaxID=34632 RepID=A0A9D4PK57_RHISA|nr:hypothetical protein HPB52_000259 [Rhipicephalus sanguineus]
MTESTVRGWRKCRDRIFQAAPTRKAFRGPKTGRFPKIKEDLAEFVRQRRGNFLPVNAELVQIKARELAREAGVPLSRAFLKCCLSNSLDGTDDDAVFADSDKDSSSEEE